MLQLLVGLVSIHRYQGDEVNLKLAKSESIILRNAIEEKTLNHEEILRIITTRSKPQLMATLNHYKDEHGCSMTKVYRNFVDKIRCFMYYYYKKIVYMLKTQCFS